MGESAFNFLHKKVINNNIAAFFIYKGHKERVRMLENHLKSLGEEPNSRAKKSSSGSDSEMDWQSGVEVKLKEAEASLQQEKERRLKIESELNELKAVAAKANKNEVE